jgi:hypothetical protein
LLIFLIRKMKFFERPELRPQLRKGPRILLRRTLWAYPARQKYLDSRVKPGNDELLLLLFYGVEGGLIIA